MYLYFRTLSNARRMFFGCCLSCVRLCFVDFHKNNNDKNEFVRVNALLVLSLSFCWTRATIHIHARITHRCIRSENTTPQSNLQNATHKKNNWFFFTLRFCSSSWSWQNLKRIDLIRLHFTCFVSLLACSAVAMALTLDSSTTLRFALALPTACCCTRIQVRVAHVEQIASREQKVFSAGRAIRTDFSSSAWIAAARAHIKMHFSFSILHVARAQIA